MTPKQKGPSAGTGEAFIDHKRNESRKALYQNPPPTGNTPDQNIEAFPDAIRAHGLEPPGLIVPGKWRRFPGAGKGPPNRAGWCFLFPDGLGGCFGDFSSGLSRSWQAKRQAPLSPAEREWFKRQVTEAKAQADADRRKVWEKAARRAGEIWQSSNPPDPRHPYLVRKGIALFPETPVRQRGESLVLPVTDFTGAITSVTSRLIREKPFRPISGETKSRSRPINKGN
uniref:Uncharacterized protein n=1 Tax=Candidatus Kentrum sp. DK TaxID=2126562 RepID=A0A450TMT4_9GAMM|nr:MAG: hypothetical protein BECKDK2373B_GA0170837_12315 [Candidatus Kentron sp. DK]